MFGKKQTDSSQMTPAQRDQLLIFAVGGATDGPVYWQARQRLESVRWAVERKRIGEHPDEQTIARAAAATTGPRPRGGDR